MTVSKLARKLKLSKFVKGVSLRLTPSEASSFDIDLLAKAKGATVAKTGDLVLATKRYHLSPSAHSVKLKPRRKLLGKARKFTVTVRITATDSAGNRTVLSKRVKVTK